jgi:TolB-like protein/Tfp pilus assembly protein PilF
LPLENRSKLGDDVFFVDGIYDDILTQLSKVSALKVISRTSAERFRDTELPIRDIAQQLGVRSVLEGGVQRAGDRVRINVQLIDAATDAHIWAENYDRELTVANILSIQSDVAIAIAAALRTELTPTEKARTKTVPTQSLQAWEAYQRGRQLLAKRTSRNVLEAQRSFSQAIELDPRFAAAHAGLADALALSSYFVGTTMEQSLGRAQAAADTALQLDPQSSDAWLSAALIADFRAHRTQAQEFYRRVLDLDHNNVTALAGYGRLLFEEGRVEEGFRSVQLAADLDPVSPQRQLQLSTAYAIRGEFDAAEAATRRALAIDGSLPLGYLTLAHLHAYAHNQYVDAIPVVLKAQELDRDSPVVFWALSQLYFDLGDDRSLVEVTRDAEKRRPTDARTQSSLALVELIQHHDAASRAHAERALEAYPLSLPAIQMLRDADLKSGQTDRALSRYEKAYPELFAQGLPSIVPKNSSIAIDIAHLLLKKGESAQAASLLDGAEKAVRTWPRLGKGGFDLMDVQISAVRGERAKALLQLREAMQVGWRQGWRYYRDYDPTLESIRNDPEFKNVFADIERDMARQRAELAKRSKDAPLDLKPTP